MEGIRAVNLADPWRCSAGDTSDLLLDPRHDPRLRIEEALLHLVPAAEPELVDRELTRPRRELRRELLGDGLVDRPVAVLGEGLLGIGRAQETEERVRFALVLARLEDRDRVFDQ